jgi:hypothetical protein
MCLMETDHFDAVLRTVEKAHAKDIEAAVAGQVEEIENAEWTVYLTGGKDGVFVKLDCDILENSIEVGYLQTVMDFDMEHIAEGDVGYGEQLLADLKKLVARTEDALIEGRKHPVE